MLHIKNEGIVRSLVSSMMRDYLINILPSPWSIMKDFAFMPVVMSLYSSSKITLISE